jgi:hypothetical protein
VKIKDLDLIKILFDLNINCKIGFDFHGVINKDPGLFSYLTNKLSETNKIYILTGGMKKDVINDLENWKIKYHYFFSISDHLISLNEKVKFKDDKNPFFDDNIWNRQKGLFCKENKIDLHFDDTSIYEEYFDQNITKFILIEG